MKRNASLTGLIIGLAIGLVLCLIVYMLLKNSTIVRNNDQMKMVAVLSRDIKSGEQVLATDIIQKPMSMLDVPVDSGIIDIPEDKIIVAKVNLSASTILTPGMLNMTDTPITKDLRNQEYNMINLPTNLSKGDFIDIRLQLPNGGDYIVVAKKEVIDCNATTVWLNMYEEEINVLSNAIIEYYIITGSKLYATTYTDPGIQEASKFTYVPNAAVVKLMTANPNFSFNIEKYTEDLKAIRNDSINNSLRPYHNDEDGDGITPALENVEEKIQKEMENLKQSREMFFATLNAATVQ